MWDLSSAKAYPQRFKISYKNSNYSYGWEIWNFYSIIFWYFYNTFVLIPSVPRCEEFVECDSIPLKYLIFYQKFKKAVFLKKYATFFSPVFWHFSKESLRKFILPRVRAYKPFTEIFKTKKKLWNILLNCEVAFVQNGKTFLFRKFGE